MPSISSRRFLLLLALVACLPLASARTVFAAKKGTIEIKVHDDKSGEPLAARMHLKDQKQKPIKPPKAVYWHDHFVFQGSITLELPPGNYFFELECGPEYKTHTGYFFLEEGASDTKDNAMERFIDMAGEGWYSGDLDAAMSASEIELRMTADDLHIVPLTSWTSKQPTKTGEAAPIAFKNNRFYQLLAGRDDRAGGALLLFGAEKPFDLSTAQFEVPSSAAWLRELKQQAGTTAVAAYAHAWDLPVWLATGQLDAIVVAGANLQREGVAVKDPPGCKPRDLTLFPGAHGPGRWSQEIYFHALNCGLRLPPVAGSGTGSSPNPLGYNRVYVHCDGDLTWDKWWQSLKQGHVVVSNGPLLLPTVNQRLPGAVFQVEAGKTLDLSIALNLSTKEKIDYLEIVQNGKVVQETRLDKWAQNNGVLPPITFRESGWMLVRAVTSNSQSYRFAMSGPFYVEVGYQPRVSKKSAQFFSDWVVERVRQIKLTDATEREAVLEYHRAARDFWKNLLDKANAE